MNEELSAKAQPHSLAKLEMLHGLINRLEDKLSPVLRPLSAAKEAAVPSEIKSEVMQELGYLENHLNSLIERLHV